MIIAAFIISFPRNAYPFETNVFSLEESTYQIEWLTLPEGWESVSGIKAGIGNDYFIIQCPNDKRDPAEIDVLDWPARVSIRFPASHGQSPEIKDEKFYPRISALFDYLSLKFVDNTWNFTLYMNDTLPYKIEDGRDWQRIYIQFQGTIWHRLEEGPGWRLWQIERFNIMGIQRAFIVQLNPGHKSMGVRVGYAGSVGLNVATVRDFVRFTGSLGGINGGYFSNKQPLGLLIVDGKIISPPMFSRPCIAFKSDGTPYIGPIKSTCRAVLGHKGTLEIDEINDFPNHGAVLLTPGHPERIRGDFKGLKLIIEDTVVVDITDGPVKDLTGKTIIWDPYGTVSLLKEIQVGERVELKYSFHGLPFEPSWLIQAGPLLVRGGNVAENFSIGSFKNDIISGRSPRTAAATTANGELLLFMGEGRQSIHSIGFALEEAASLLVEAGAVTAINLDGGSSSSLFVNGRYCGYPSAEAWKAVPDVIFFGNQNWGGENIAF